MAKVWFSKPEEALNDIECMECDGVIFEGEKYVQYKENGGEESTVCLDCKDRILNYPEDDEY